MYRNTGEQTFSMVILAIFVIAVLFIYIMLGGIGGLMADGMGIDVDFFQPAMQIVKGLF